MFRLGSKNIIGLDIGSASIKAVQLRETSNGLRLEAAGIAQNPTAGLEGKETSKTGQMIADTIKNLIQENNIKGKNVVSSLSGPPVSIQYFEFPKLSPDELEGAVRLEAEQVMSSDIKDMDMDFQVLSNTSEAKKIKVLFVAVPKRMTEERVEVIQQAGLNPIIVDVDSLALANCFLRMGEALDDKTLIILNVGAQLTNLGILRKGNMQLVRDISFGGNDITGTIAKERMISLEEAEHKKKTPSLWTEQNLEMISLLRRRATKLVNEINRSWGYYQTRTSVEKVNRILLMGGSSKLAPLVQFISECMDVPVQEWNPLEHLELHEKKFDPQFRQELGPALAVAIGLALRKV